MSFNFDLKLSRMLTRELFATTLLMGLALSVSVGGMLQVYGGTQVPASAQQICPALAGTKIPNAVFTKIDGTTLDLMTVVSQKPTVLIFYRGGW